MLQNLKTIHKTDLVKNGLTLLSANSISQVIAISVYPLITRFYSPADLGALTLFLSFAGVASIIASGKYESAILLEKENKNAGAAFDLVFLINLITCTILFIVIIPIRNQIVYLFNAKIISAFLPYLPLYIFFSVLGYVATFWYNRINRFSVSAQYSISQSIINNGLKIGFGGLGLTCWGLFLSTLASQISATGALFLRKKNREGLFVFNLQRLGYIAKSHYKFPAYTLPHSLINTIAGNLPIIILSAWFNMTEVGLISLGITLGFRPINLISASINQVLFQKVTSNQHSEQKSLSLLLQFCKKTILYGLPIFIPLFIFIKPIVTALFSSKWIGSGEYLQYMMPWFFISLMSSSLCFMPAAAQKQRTAMTVEIIYTIIRISALFIGIWLHNIKLAVLLFSAVNCLFITGQLVWYLHLARNIDESSAIIIQMQSR